MVESMSRTPHPTGQPVPPTASMLLVAPMPLSTPTSATGPATRASTSEGPQVLIHYWGASAACFLLFILQVRSWPPTKEKESKLSGGQVLPLPLQNCSHPIPSPCLQVIRRPRPGTAPPPIEKEERRKLLSGQVIPLPLQNCSHPIPSLPISAGHPSTTPGHRGGSHNHPAPPQGG